MQVLYRARYRARLDLQAFPVNGMCAGVPSAHYTDVLSVRTHEHSIPKTLIWHVASKAFAKHERARERGDDIVHEDHQKRLKVGRDRSSVDPYRPQATSCGQR